jgi:hypothetical protein
VNKIIEVTETKKVIDRKETKKATMVQASSTKAMETGTKQRN